MNPKNAIGYCAVVMPSIDHWQGYFIIDDEGLRSNAVMMQMTSLMTMPKAHPVGALQAVLVEGSLENNQTVVGAAALALRGVVQSDFFYIKATREPEGTRTELIKLDATTVDEARKLIDALPEVQDIKRRLMAKMNMRPGMGRKHAFH